MRNATGEALSIRRVIESRYRSRVDRTIEDQYRSCCEGDTCDSFGFAESGTASLPPRHKSTRNTVLFSGTYTGYHVKVELIVLLSHREYPTCSQRAIRYIYKV